MKLTHSDGKIEDMKTMLRGFALSILGLTFGWNAFAIDQVVLKNGSIIEGKVLSEVPNRYVDIKLVNGSKKRYQQSDVASVERDVPSNIDSRMSGSTSEVFFGVNLGGFTDLSLSSSPIKFNWGGRFGVNAAQLGDFSKLAFAISYNHTSNSVTDGTDKASATLSELGAQMLFRKVGNTGFYFGPEIGLAILSLTVNADSGSDSAFFYGAVTGYDYYLSNGFSMGPQVQITHFTGNTPLKFSLDGTFHF